MKINANTNCFDELEEAITHQYVLRTSGYDYSERVVPERTDLGNRLVDAGVWDGDKRDDERSKLELERQSEPYEEQSNHEVKVLTTFNVSGHLYANISIPEIPGSDYWISI
jgi:hypothetical protein